ncbi:MAG: hypothetical protein J6Y92_11700 [Lentisphaeria bacterium]|nr:hypothetical protein [Lentisphaeria bacterium]
MAQGNEHVAARKLIDHPDPAIILAVLVQTADEIPQKRHIRFDLGRCRHMDPNRVPAVCARLFLVRDLDRCAVRLKLFAQDPAQFGKIAVRNERIPFFQKLLRILIPIIQVILFGEPLHTLAALVATFDRGFGDDPESGHGEFFLESGMVFAGRISLSEDQDVLRTQMRPRHHRLVDQMPPRALPEEPDKKVALYDQIIISTLFRNMVVEAVNIFPFDETEMDEAFFIRIVQSADQVPDAHPVMFQFIRCSKKEFDLLHDDFSWGIGLMKDNTIKIPQFYYFSNKKLQKKSRNRKKQKNSPDRTGGILLQKNDIGKVGICAPFRPSFSAAPHARRPSDR